MTNVLMIGACSEYSRGLESRLAVESGLRLVRARSAMEGFEAFIREDVDLVVVDLGVRDRDGVGVIETLRAARPAPAMTIVALMMSEDPACEQRVLNAGASEVVVKSTDVKDVVERMACAAMEMASQSVGSVRDRVDVSGAMTNSVQAVFHREFGVEVAQSDNEDALPTSAEVLRVDVAFTGAVAGVLSIQLTKDDAESMQQLQESHATFDASRWLEVVGMVSDEVGSALVASQLAVTFAVPVLVVGRGMHTQVESVEAPSVVTLEVGGNRLYVECAFCASRTGSDVEALAAR